MLLLLLLAPTRLSAVDVASNGKTFFIVWRILAPGPFADRYYGALASPNGLPLGSAISLGAGRGPLSVASNGRTFLVSRTSLGQLLIKPFQEASAGAWKEIHPATMAGLTSNAGHNDPSYISWNGSHYVIAWGTFRIQEQPLAIVAETVAALVGDEAVFRNDIVVDDYSGAAGAASASGASVVLSRDRYGLAATSLTNGGEAGQRFEITPAYVGSPAIASSGSNFLIAWVENTQLKGRLLDAVGKPIQEEFVIAVESSFFGLDLVWNGIAFRVVWSASNGANGYDIRATRVTASGINLDPTPVFVTTNPGNQVAPAVASNGEFDLVVWESGPGRIEGAAIDRANRVTPEPEKGGVSFSQLSSRRRVASSPLATVARP